MTRGRTRLTSQYISQAAWGDGEGRRQNRASARGEGRGGHSGWKERRGIPGRSRKSENELTYRLVERGRVVPQGVLLQVLDDEAEGVEGMVLAHGARGIAQVCLERIERAKRDERQENAHAVQITWLSESPSQRGRNSRAKTAPTASLAMRIFGFSSAKSHSTCAGV